jgi:hypothetical protein
VELQQDADDGRSRVAVELVTDLNRHPAAGTLDLGVGAFSTKTAP